MATKSGPPGPLLVAIIGPPVYFSWQKAVHPSEKWTGCSFRSLARLWGYKKHYSFMIVLCHDREFRLFCYSHHQPGSWPRKWTRSSFHFANGGPGPVFAQPKVDLSSFRSAKNGPGSSGVFRNKSGLHIQIAFSDYDIKLCVHSFTTADKLLAAINLQFVSVV